MADTSQARPVNQRVIRDRLSLWEAKTNPTAPLTGKQKDALIELTSIAAERPMPPEVSIFVAQICGFPFCFPSDERRPNPSASPFPWTILMFWTRSCSLLLLTIVTFLLILTDSVCLFCFILFLLIRQNCCDLHCSALVKLTGWWSVIREVFININGLLDLITVWLTGWGWNPQDAEHSNF